MSNSIKHYDPRLNSKGEETEKQSIIWTTKSVNHALDMVMLGQDLDRSPFYEGKIDRKRADLVFHFSDYEVEEFTRCSVDILYFIDNYCKIKLPDGSVGLITHLRKYQLGQIIDYLEHDEIILGWSRQSGKTIGTILYILWCMIFNVDKSVAILANKAKTSGEIMEKLQEIYGYLPFWMKPGIEGWNTSTLSFDNGCRAYTGPTTPDALNGRTCNILYIDEFAYIGRGKNKIEYQRDFLANAKPILASQKDSGLCKLIISSTPYGKEYFYELFDNALKGLNGMKASVVRWWQIPGRDLEWAKNEIATIGITKFRQQFEVSFNIHATTLLNSSTMRNLQVNKIEFEEGGEGMVSDYEDSLTINSNLDPLSYDDYICLSVDIAEGLGKDYSVIQILRMSIDYDKGELVYEQVGKFSSNEIPIEKLVIITKELFSLFNEDKVKILVESNTYGDFFFKCFDLDESIDVPMEAICMFKRTADSIKASRGLRTNRAIKPIAVSAFKKLTDSQNLKVFDSTTISQIENFQEDDKGNYQASIGHDDDVTPLINFSYWVQLGEVDYQNWFEEYLAELGIEYELEMPEDNYYD